MMPRPMCLAYMGFPAQHRAKLHSTNPLERLNGEIKRRSEVVGIFPNEAAVIRLIGAIAAGAERGVGGPARPLHEPGNHRSSERCSHSHSAHCGSLIEQPTLLRIAAPTPRPGARSSPRRTESLITKIGMSVRPSGRGSSGLVIADSVPGAMISLSRRNFGSSLWASLMPSRSRSVHSEFRQRPRERPLRRARAEFGPRADRF